jgi:GT2 family glycosyltransferase
VPELNFDDQSFTAGHVCSENGSRSSEGAFLAVVIPVHNGRDFLSANLESLRDQSHPPDLVIVVDDYSSDGSLELARTFSPRIMTARLPKNEGFGRASNHGIRLALAAGADYVLVLNQDTVLESHACEIVRDVLHRNPTFGMMALFQLRYDGAGIDPIFRQFLPASWFDDLYFGRQRTVYEADFVPAAAAVLRRSTLEEVGGFDPLFFMYKEDRDVCKRLLAHGWKIGISTGARVRHRCGQVHAERTWQWDCNWAYSDALYHLKWSPRPWPIPILTLLKYFFRPPSARELAARLVAILRCLSQIRTIARHRAGNPADLRGSETQYDSGPQATVKPRNSADHVEAAASQSGVPQ